MFFSCFVIIIRYYKVVPTRNLLQLEIEGILKNFQLHKICTVEILFWSQNKFDALGMMIDEIICTGKPIVNHYLLKT